MFIKSFGINSMQKTNKLVEQSVYKRERDLQQPVDQSSPTKHMQSVRMCVCISVTTQRVCNTHNIRRNYAARYRGLYAR